MRADSGHTHFRKGGTCGAMGRHRLDSQVSRHHKRLSKPKDFSFLPVLEFQDYGKEEKHSHKYHIQVVPGLVTEKCICLLYDAINVFFFPCWYYLFVINIVWHHVLNISKTNVILVLFTINSSYFILDNSIDAQPLSKTSCFLLPYFAKH